MSGARQTVLVLGGSSYVGRRLCRRMGPDIAVATYFSKPIEGGVFFDSTAMAIGPLLQKFPNLTHCVILLADSQPDSCFADPTRAHAINVESVKAIADALIERGVVPVFTSTEFVFDGGKGDYTETDAPHPILLYGAHKLEVERHLQASGRPFVIFRLAKVYGEEPGDGTIFAGWIKQLQGRPASLRCAADQAFSPVHVDDVADAIVNAVDMRLDGLFHLSGNRRWRRIELLDMLIGEIGRFTEIETVVEPCSINDFDLPEARPVDVSMRADKLAAATGAGFIQAEDACRRLVERAFG